MFTLDWSRGGGLKQPNDKCNAYFVAVVVYFSYTCTLHICTYAYSIVIKYNTLYMVYFKEKAARTLHKRYEKIPVNFIQTMSCAPSALFFFCALYFWNSRSAVRRVYDNDVTQTCE